jgi:hypothetical protein
MSTDTCTTTACETSAVHDHSEASETQLKAAIVVLSDPKSGSQEEALGRVFNALAAAYDFKQRGDDVSVLFQGAGTRWIGQLSQADHPAHALYKEVEDTIAGVSCGCADVFGGSEVRPGPDHRQPGPRHNRHAESGVAGRRRPHDSYVLSSTSDRSQLWGGLPTAPQR